MPYISNDPALWPFINETRTLSYVAVASSAAVVYDCTLTFGQEFDLVWKRRWSLMTVLYVCVRYIGILYSVFSILPNIPISNTDLGGTILWFMYVWTPVVVNCMLAVIMLVRIHAMYQRSKKMLIFLVALLLASTIASTVITAMGNIGVSGVEAVLSGNRSCFINISPDRIELNNKNLTSTAAWEILVFFLAVWIVIKHFYELRQLPTGPTIGDSFTVLAESHALYFVAFAAVASLSLGSLSPTIEFSVSAGVGVYEGVLQIAQVLQMFVLGPRLILSVRNYHTKLVTRSDEGTGMTSIAFEAGGDLSAGGDV
ncbi:hypothetical protein CY34DRAFT_804340 [Suillus luteus UH-Slu-Lm8-n1]|uniref:DUF6533 domain-containing protein n=1 Tax=Suillus luteus UH-Slu-Lm8-n1 TaxID=930992 RepID=A0A0C9ZZ28_9AGAM|nr:hypothetical protein CY34DRAFT_804340 [Suillus luteus UH-Slu-Lm8-n1]